MSRVQKHSNLIDDIVRKWIFNFRFEALSIRKSSFKMQHRAKGLIELTNAQYASNVQYQMTVALFTAIIDIGRFR